MKLDNLHYSLNRLLSHNKPFNFVISAREAGKSTAIWLYSYKQFTKGKTTLVIRRMSADITETYISDVENILNKFLDNPIKLCYKKGDLDEGVATIYIDEKPFFRVISLSNPMSRIKSLMFPNLKLVLFDEFICNTRMKEKYLDNEIFRFKEVFNTFQRESEGLVCIFAGNPYSLYNPYFAWIGVDIRQLYAGNFVVGATWCVEVYELLPELKEAILKKNPLYQFDDSYKKYGFDGRAINDNQIKVVPTCPNNFQLRYVFYVGQKILGIYRNTSTSMTKNYDFFWMGILPEYNSTRRDITCFNYNDLIEGTYLFDPKDKRDFGFLKDCFRTRTISYKTIEESYLFEQVFNVI